MLRKTDAHDDEDFFRFQQSETYWKLFELMYMDIDNLFLGFVAIFLKLKHVTYSE